MSLTSGWYLFILCFGLVKMNLELCVGKWNQSKIFNKGVLSVQVSVTLLVVPLFMSSANNVKGCGVLHAQPPIAKEPYCQRDPLNWDGLLWSVTKKEAVWESRPDRALCCHAAAGVVQHGRFIGQANDRPEERKTQIGSPYLIPVFATPPPPLSSCFSFPLSLLLNCFHGREETDMDRALISDTGKHFYLFLPLPIHPRCTLLVYLSYWVNTTAFLTVWTLGLKCWIAWVEGLLQRISCRILKIIRTVVFFFFFNKILPCGNKDICQCKWPFIIYNGDTHAIVLQLSMSPDNVS